MSISYQFGDVDAHGAMIRSQAASLEAEHQSIVRDVLAAGDFWGGSGSVACQEFITQLGRNFQTIYEQANSHGQKVQTAGNNMNSHRQRRRLQLGLTRSVDGEIPRAGPPRVRRLAILADAAVRGGHGLGSPGRERLLRAGAQETVGPTRKSGCCSSDRLRDAKCSPQHSVRRRCSSMPQHRGGVCSRQR